MIKKNILITSAGVTTAINVIFALRKSTYFNCNIVATDMNINSVGLHLANSHYITPNAKSPNFIPFIKKIIKKEKIDYIFAMHSSEISLFSKNKSLFENLNCGITIANENIVEICNDKTAFLTFLQQHNFPYPKTYNNIDEINKFPIFIKPINGSSSNNTHKVNNKKELEFYLNPSKTSYILQEFIEEQEITVDCFVNKKGYMIACVPRKRIHIKDGKAIVSKTFQNTHITTLVQQILKNLNYTGACNIQFFYDKNTLKVIELNPRLSAGGLPLTIEAGVNIPELMLLDFFDKTKNELLSFTQDLTMYRYLTEIFK